LEKLKLIKIVKWPLARGKPKKTSFNFSKYTKLKSVLLAEGVKKYLSRAVISNHPLCLSFIIGWGGGRILQQKVFSFNIFHFTIQHQKRPSKINFGKIKTDQKSEITSS